MTKRELKDLFLDWVGKTVPYAVWLGFTFVVVLVVMFLIQATRNAGWWG